GAIEHFRSSIRATRAALALTQTQHHRIDTRRHRLLHDLGAYTQALGITLRDPRVIDEAASHFQSALESISATTAPALFAQMAAGLFYLHFSRRRWAQAAALFDDMEAAWDAILADPTLSSAVYQQQTRDLSGQYARAAWCHWAL